MISCPVTTADAVPERLRQIGLPEEDLLRASVEAGLTAFLNCPRLAPITGPGQLMHIEIVGALRARLEMLHWNAECQHNQEPTISPDSRIRLIVMSGDEATGLEGETPLSRHPRGRLSASNVVRNQLVFDLYPGTQVLPGDLPDQQLTWALVHYVDLGAREVRLEVSAPKELGDDRRVGGWIERIIIGPVSFDGPDPVRLPIDPAPAQPVDVPIRRLSS
jgi:hypothetical protein